MGDTVPAAASGPDGAVQLRSARSSDRAPHVPVSRVTYGDSRSFTEQTVALLA